MGKVLGSSYPDATRHTLIPSGISATLTIKSRTPTRRMSIPSPLNATGPFQTRTKKERWQITFSEPRG
jgi:hypothetical protein